MQEMKIKKAISLFQTWNTTEWGSEKSSLEHHCLLQKNDKPAS